MNESPFDPIQIRSPLKTTLVRKLVLPISAFQINEHFDSIEGIGVGFSEGIRVARPRRPVRVKPVLIMKISFIG
jgi:hypothetical protein